METMLLEELTSKYLPVYPQDNSWEKTVEYLYKEQSEFMETLSKSIASKGIRQPVILSLEEESTDAGYYIWDGTHRVALALKEGIKEIPVHYGYPALSEEFPLVEIVASFEEEITDGLFDETIDCVHSWPLNEDIWINTLAMSLFDKKVLTVTLEHYKEELFPEILAGITRELNDAGVTGFTLEARYELEDEAYEVS